jgi:2-oxoglutarate dehydrogenase E2 component (dihydrolipoamide succinyltransferase)
MLVDLVIPEVGESIHEVQVLQWKKQPGDAVQKDEELVEIETEKATVPVIAPAAGRLAEVLKKDGEFAEVGDTLGRIEAADQPARATSHRPSEQAATAVAAAGREAVAVPPPAPPTAASPAARPAAAGSVEAARKPPAESERTDSSAEEFSTKKPGKPPANHPPQPSEPPPSPAGPTAEQRARPAGKRAPAPQPDARVIALSNGRTEQRVTMNLLRQTIARRLVEAQRNAALVTTFNEVDMQEVIDLRRQFGGTFRERYETKLGFMSFFVKAAVEGLKRCPELNAQIEGREIVYRNYYDIGVAVGSGRGLVVPVLRNCERLSFADIERQIAGFAERAAAGRLAPSELEGGTFTISNGGVYGSLLSTPIINPPQSGVLGMHTIQERPVARNGQVVIRPMMYIALTYDHRLVDGREAVGFLRRIKEVIETPSRLFLEV